MINCRNPCQVQLLHTRPKLSFIMSLKFHFPNTLSLDKTLVYISFCERYIVSAHQIQTHGLHFTWDIRNRATGTQYVRV
jgi:hypothetical protein